MVWACLSQLVIHISKSATWLSLSAIPKGVGVHHSLTDQSFQAQADAWNWILLSHGQDGLPRSLIPKVLLGSSINVFKIYFFMVNALQINWSSLFFFNLFKSFQPKRWRGVTISSVHSEKFPAWNFLIWIFFPKT